MRRQQLAIVALLTIVVLALFYLFLYRPKTAQVAQIRADIDVVKAEQTTLQTRIDTLTQVRANAPEIEAAIAAAEAVIPREVALPAALRQLVLAADDSGVTLSGISPSRPEPDPSGQPGLARIGLSVAISGGYFQVVDFLRRVEDPSITPRAIVWTSVNVAGSPDAYPTLQVGATGEMYALLPAAPVPPDPNAPATDVPTEAVG